MLCHVDASSPLSCGTGVVKRKKKNTKLVRPGFAREEAARAEAETLSALANAKAQASASPPATASHIDPDSVRPQQATYRGPATVTTAGGMKQPPERSSAGRPQQAAAQPSAPPASGGLEAQPTRREPDTTGLKLPPRPSEMPPESPGVSTRTPICICIHRHIYNAAAPSGTSCKPA